MLELTNCTEVVINWLSSLSLATPPVIDSNDNIEKNMKKVSEINWLSPLSLAEPPVKESSSSTTVRIPSFRKLINEM